MENKNINILVVDDDVILLNMYKERLMASGYNVIIAKDGEEAIKVAQEKMPSAILLDIMMPKVNGFDVLKILKQNPKTKNIPILILTALAADNHKTKGISDGADDFVVKSDIMPKEVIVKIENLIHKGCAQNPQNNSIQG